MCFKFSLQEANKCKTELQYWRSKSPATTVSNPFGHLAAVPPENLQAIVDIGIRAENFNLSAEIDKENPVQINENIVDLKLNKETDTIIAAEPTSTLVQLLPPPESISLDVNHKWSHTESDKRPSTDDEPFVDVYYPIGSPKIGDKRKADDEPLAGSAASRSTNSNNGSSDIKKARRVQNKVRCQTKVNSNKTRSK